MVSNFTSQVVAGLLIPIYIKKLDFKTRDELQQMPQTEEEHLENQYLDYEDKEKSIADAEVKNFVSTLSFWSGNYPIMNISRVQSQNFISFSFSSQFMFCPQNAANLSELSRSEAFLQKYCRKEGHGAGISRNTAWIFFSSQLDVVLYFLLSNKKSFKSAW